MKRTCHSYEKEGLRAYLTIVTKIYLDKVREGLIGQTTNLLPSGREGSNPFLVVNYTFLSTLKL